MTSTHSSSFRALALSTVALLASTSGGSAQNAGWPGPSYAGAQSVPTGSKAQSKLWWNDGLWWGCLWSEEAQAFMIHGLAPATQTWLDTGTAVDVRPKSRCDCLWDGTKLYIASHQYTDGVGAPGHPLELYRYSYVPSRHRYSLDIGFPTLIGDAKTEALVIDKDSKGALWAVWMAGLRVWTAHTEGDDRSWSAPRVLPLNATDLDEDDNASVVAFDGKVGVLWSDQVRDAFYFTYHEDGAPPGAWSPLETVLAGPNLAEDDLCLKAASDGSLYAALGTNTDEVRLEVRNPLGAWSDHLVAADADDWLHSIVVLDEEHRSVHVFGSRPAVMGSIHEKTASMDAPTFAAGGGVPVIRDASNPAVGEATSTKSTVNGGTGLVVLASHEGLERYAHHRDSLGGPRPSPPVAVFHADPGEGFQPVTVQFLDASSGRPRRWAWSFGDGATSTSRQPVHTYAGAGLYTVSLRVTNDLGTDQLTRADLIRVEPPPTALVLRPIADGHAHEGAPDANFGGLEYLRLRGGRDTDYRGYLKFFVPPTQSQITAAELRLTCLVGSSDGGSLYRAGDDWEEPTLTWNDMPAVNSQLLVQVGAAREGEVITLDVTSTVSGSGSVSFGLRSSSFHSVHYSSRQGVAPPELRLEFQAPLSAAPRAGFEARRRCGRAPLTVQFADASTGRIDSWAWDFGDGSTSDLQNPSHVYRRPGRYAVSLRVTGESGTDIQLGPEFVSVLPRSLPPAADEDE